MSESITPRAAMALAIEEGKKGAGFVSPNPLVGCVIVDRNGQLLSVGHHAKVGEAHAEINALNAVKDPSALDGAHFYVTLEPCAHEGRTPSCAKALAKLPIAAVTYGLRDPNPLVAGLGAEILRQAGKRVELAADSMPDLQAALEELAEIFLLNQTQRRPFITVKVATSLDGKMALLDGTSQWITGEAARAAVHRLRGAYDAVLTGVGTFLRDDPQLNARDPRFANRASRVILLDPEGRSYAKLGSSRLAQVRAPEDIWIVTAPGMAPPPIGKHIVVTDRDRDFDLRALAMRLHQEGVHSLFVEGGPLTTSSFIRYGLVDRFYQFIAPKIIGDGLSFMHGMRLDRLSDAVSFRTPRIELIGSDVMWTAACVSPKSIPASV